LVVAEVLNVPQSVYGAVFDGAAITVSPSIGVPFDPVTVTVNVIELGLATGTVVLAGETEILRMYGICVTVNGVGVVPPEGGVDTAPEFASTA